ICSSLGFTPLLLAAPLVCGLLSLTLALQALGLLLSRLCFHLGFFSLKFFKLIFGLGMNASYEFINCLRYRLFLRLVESFTYLRVCRDNKPFVIFRALQGFLDCAACGNVEIVSLVEIFSDLSLVAAH